MTDRQVELRAAACAAANWARARRAAWSDEAVAVILAGAVPTIPTAAGRLLSPTAVGRLLSDPAYRQAPAHLVALVADAAAEMAHAFPRAKMIHVGLKILKPAAAVAAVLALAVLGRVSWQQAMKTDTAAKLRAAAAIASLPAPVAVIDRSTGGLRVTADPEPARVIIDGKPRGMTPLLVERLKVGSHSVVLESAGGTVEDSVRITGGDTQEINESIYAGWLTLFAPFDVVVTEHGRALALDERHQMMLPPGRHDLRFENRDLDYAGTRRVEIRPGEMTALSIALPQSTLSVTSNAPAQVWVDGKLIGDTPLEAVPVDLGTHTVVLKRADGDQRQRSVKVTVKPVDLAVEF